MAALICCWLWLDQQWIKVVDENGCVCVNLLWLNDANVHCGPIQLIHIIILWCNFTLFFFSILFPFPVLLPPLLLSVLCAKTHPHTHFHRKKTRFYYNKIARKSNRYYNAVNMITIWRCWLVLCSAVSALSWYCWHLCYGGKCSNQSCLYFLCSTALALCRALSGFMLYLALVHPSSRWFFRRKRCVVVILRT